MSQCHEAAVDEFVRRVETADPTAVERLLFGSVARDEERAYSDVPSQAGL